MLGMYTDFTPKFVKKYVNLSDEITKGTHKYIEELKTEEFPAKEHTFGIDEEVLKAIKS